MAPVPVFDAMEASGSRVRSLTLWRRVGSRVRSWTLWRPVGSSSGLGRHGVEWVQGPVLDALEASGLQFRSWTLWRRVGSSSGVGRHGGEWAPGPVLGALEATKLSTSAGNQTIPYSIMQTVA